ncbi:MAG TPA: hypothetical protein VF559_09745 [Caulobacteraceae bacterium]|jgi:hypothetical protein
MARPGKLKGRKNSESGGPVYFRHPLDGVDRTLLRKAGLEYARQQQTAYSDELDRVLSILSSTEPVSLISVIAAYGLTGGASADEIPISGMLGDKISQHHVELLQALALTLPQEKWGILPPTPPVVQTAIDSLSALGTAFHQRRLSALIEADPSDQPSLYIQEQVRTHTQAVRNWGFIDDVITLSTELYAPLDDILHPLFGLDAGTLIRIFHHLLRETEARLSYRWRQLGKIRRERTARRILTRYGEYFDLPDDMEALAASLGRGLSAEAAMFLVLSHADLGLRKLFTHSIPNLARDLGIGEDRLQLCFSRLALVAGELSGVEREHIFLENPVWLRPILRLNSEEIFTPLSQAFFSHIHRIMLAASQDVSVADQLFKRRAKYLESKAAELFSQALPGALIHQGLSWSLQEANGEVDLLVRYHDALLVVEAKSGAFTPPALRGGLDRLKRHIQDLVVDPSRQADRLLQLLTRATQGDSRAEAILEPVLGDVSDIHVVLRVSVSLEHLSVLPNMERELKAVGWVPPDYSLAPCINLGDLKCITHILSRPAFFIDYLKERDRLQGSLSIMGDELDLLGIYLVSGFGLYQMEEKDARLMALGMSTSVDKYFTARAEGIEISKPKPKITSFWSMILSGLEARRPKGWVSICLDLLRCASPDEQRRIEREFRRIAAIYKRTWREKDCLNAVVIVPPPTREAAVVIATLHDKRWDDRHDAIENLAGQAFERSTAIRCVVIVKRLERLDEPYASLGVFTRPAE